MDTHVAIAVLVGALFVAGCGGSQPPQPAAPTTPTVETPVPPGVILGTYSVSGVVAENGLTIANAFVNAWVDLGRSGYSYWYAHGQLVADAAGNYRMTGLPGGARLTFQTWRDGYQQQCAAPSVVVQGDMTVNLALTSNANVSTTPASAPGSRSVWGTVVQMTGSGKQPVGGVFVDYEPLMDFPAASTHSDAYGRFGLCGLPQNVTASIGAGLNGRVAFVDVAPGQDNVEIVLP